MESTGQPPKWYLAISGCILLWNLFGVFVFTVMVLMVSGRLDIASEQALANMDEAQRAQTLATKQVILSTPMWANVAFAVAVGFGVLGSIALLMRKRLAVACFFISLAGVLAQNAYNYLLSDAIEKIGVGLSPFVILIAIVTVPFALFGSKSGWLESLSTS